MNPPSRLYGFLAMIAKHIHDNNSKFVCVIARGEDGKYEVYNGDVVNVDDLKGAADAIKETMDDFVKKAK